jgi:hypothetical protein
MARRLPAISAHALSRDCGARQHIAVVGRRLFIKIEGKPSEFLGPHAVEAKEFALSVWSAKRK